MKTSKWPHMSLNSDELTGIITNHTGHSQQDSSLTYFRKDHGSIMQIVTFNVTTSFRTDAACPTKLWNCYNFGYVMIIQYSIQFHLETESNCHLPSEHTKMKCIHWSINVSVSSAFTRGYGHRLPCERVWIRLPKQASREIKRRNKRPTWYVVSTEERKDVTLFDQTGRIGLSVYTVESC